MEKMEIDGCWKEKEKEEPKRIDRKELARREYRVTWRAVDAVNKLAAARHYQELRKWRSFSKQRLIQEELFFSHDIDFNRISLSDAPAPARARRLVSRKAKIKKKKAKAKAKPKPAGGATSTSTSPGVKLSYTPIEQDLVSDKQMLQPAPAPAPAPAGGVISPGIA